MHPVGVGRSLRTKVNANIGNSQKGSSVAEELLKLETSVRYGADAVMDLSTGPDLDEIRSSIIAGSPLPVGTVPVYAAAAKVDRFIDLSADDLLAELRHQAAQGVDFFTIHVGLIRAHLPLIQDRITGIVSRGGSLMATWMIHHDSVYLFYGRFGEVLYICRALFVA